MIHFEDFEKVDMRVGQVVDVEDFPRAKNSSYRVKVDFGDSIGTRKLQSAGQEGLHS